MASDVDVADLKMNWYALGSVDVSASPTTWHRVTTWQILSEVAVGSFDSYCVVTAQVESSSHVLSELDVFGTFTYWVPVQGVNSVHIRSDVDDGATLAYWEAAHEVYCLQILSDKTPAPEISPSLKMYCSAEHIVCVAHKRSEMAVGACD
jgi:hypothetical protein